MEKQLPIALIVTLLVLVVISSIYHITKGKQTITTTTSPTTTTIRLISEQEALDLANNHIQSKCPNINYDSISKISWDRDKYRHTIFYLKPEICPDIEDYVYSEIWQAKKYLNETECPTTEVCPATSTYVGIDGEFKCSYGFYIWGTGLYKLKNIC